MGAIFMKFGRAPATIISLSIYRSWPLAEADGLKLSLIRCKDVNHDAISGSFIYPRFIDNDASLLLVMLRCLRFNPVNSSQISSIMQSSPRVRW